MSYEAPLINTIKLNEMRTKEAFDLYFSSPGSTPYQSSSKQRRLWVDSLNIFGVDMLKSIIAYEGTDSTGDITAGTAAAALHYFSLDTLENGSEVTLSIDIVLTSELKTELDTALTQVASNEAETKTMTFGTFNSAQEYKKDDEWAKVIDFSSLVLVPKSADQFSFDYLSETGKALGGNTDAQLYSLEIRGMQIDKTADTSLVSFDVITEKSTDQTVLTIGGADASVTA